MGVDRTVPYRGWGKPQACTSYARCRLRRPAALPPAVRKGCAFPTVCPLTNLPRAAGRLSLPAARRGKKKGELGRKGRALPHSGAAEPPRQSDATTNLDSFAACCPLIAVTRGEDNCCAGDEGKQ